RMTLIPNGVALPDPGVQAATVAAGTDPRGNGPLVGMVGRLGWKKGYEFAIDAFARIHAALPEARFDIVGDGSLRSQLEAEAERAGLSSRLRFLGQRRDVPELMRG